MPIKSNIEVIQFETQREFGNYMLETILKGDTNMILFNGDKREFRENLKFFCDKEYRKHKHVDPNVVKDLENYNEYIIVKKKI